MACLPTVFSIPNYIGSLPCAPCSQFPSTLQSCKEATEPWPRSESFLPFVLSGGQNPASSPFIGKLLQLTHRSQKERELGWREASRASILRGFEKQAATGGKETFKCVCSAYQGCWQQILFGSGHGKGRKVMILRVNINGHGTSVLPKLDFFFWKC